MEVALLAVAVAALLVAFGAFVLVRRRGRRGPAGEPAVRPVTEPGRAPVPLERARAGLGSKIRSLVGGKAPGADDWSELEDTLVRADVGPAASAELVARLRERFTPQADPAALLEEEVVRILDPSAGGGDGTPTRDAAGLNLPPGELGVVMVVGVNGTGKTTSIGKLAHLLAAGGRTVCLANSDTYRAAAAEQLGVWAGRAEVHLVAQGRGADPGAVAFDAVQAARARGADVLIVDTAGRIHTRQPLMDELAKVRRVLERAAGDVEEVLLTIDATTGQNGIAQARAFAAAAGVTGAILTKMDGTARGGIVLAVRQELGVPVKLVGTGEGSGDLEPFDPRGFARGLVD
jgi:fused signal recognition particle receptor